MKDKKVYFHIHETCMIYIIQLGYYCPASTVNIPLTSPKPCPVGYYGNRTMLKADTECTICDGGKYCSGEGEKFVCLSGFFSSGFITIIKYNLHIAYMMPI